MRIGPSWLAPAACMLMMAECLAPGIAQAADADLIPREVFFGNPDRANVQL